MPEHRTYDRHTFLSELSRSQVPIPKHEQDGTIDQLSIDRILRGLYDQSKANTHHSF